MGAYVNPGTKNMEIDIDDKLVQDCSCKAADIQKTDKDILEALKAEGKGYQTRIIKILRDAVLGS